MEALGIADRGEYATDKVIATTDDHYIARYFEKKGNCFAIKDSIKRLVVFDLHNLKNENGLIGLDFIFCRNVMIYFDISEQKRLVNKFYKSLKPGGYLFLGHAESLHGMGTDFQFIYENMGTAYKKPGG